MIRYDRIMVQLRANVPASLIDVQTDGSWAAFVPAM